jgi:hypothetical protein
LFNTKDRETERCTKDISHISQNYRRDCEARKENSVAADPSSPAGPNRLSENVDSLGSDENPAGEFHDGSISEKMDDDGSILNYPILNKKHKKKKAKAAIETAEREASEAALKAEAEKESVPEPEPQSETQPEEPNPTESKETEAQPAEAESEPTPVE